MVRFRHLALVFLFPSPAEAAEGVPLEVGAFLGDEGCAGGQSQAGMHAERAFA